MLRVETMPKTNLRWEVKKLQRAGHSSSRITKQVQHRLKRAHAGKLHPGRSGDKIQSLAEETVRKQRYHLTKQLHQAMKKAKSFLLRKLMRRGKEGSKAEGGGEAEERLRVLRALPLHEVARTALSSLGMDDDGGHAHKDDEAGLQEWRPLQARLPALCERTERQLLAAAAVVLQMEKLREHARRHEGAAAAEVGEPSDTDEPSEARRDARPTGKARPQTGMAAAAAGRGAGSAAPPRAAAPRAAAPRAERADASTKPEAPQSQFIESLAGAGAGTGAGAGASTSAPRSRKRAQSEASGAAKAPRVRKRDAEARAAAEAEAGDDAAGGGAAMLTMGSADEEQGGGGGTARKKVKNTISRSGNRMGQTQRRRLVEEELAKKEGRPPPPRPGKGSGRGGGKGRGGGARNAAEAGGRGGGGGAGGGGAAAEAVKLHPSWEASQQANTKGSIQKFEGKKVTFD